MKAIPSRYQKAVVEFVKKGKGHGMVGAVAGSGKTFTLTEFIAPVIAGKALFLAFNKTIATKLQEELPRNFYARTIHSLGFSIVKRAYEDTQLKPYKYKDMVKNLCKALPGASRELRKRIKNREVDIYTPLVRMVDFTRQTMTEPSNWDEVRDMCLHYGIDLPGDDEAETYVLEKNEELLNAGELEAPSRIDYTDMLWIAARLDEGPRSKYDWVLVDEAQDLSKAQLEVVKKAIKRGGRAIFVGDRKQAIQGFCGADSNSFDSIKEEMNATELPLSICYRCPRSHLELAKELVPEIEPRIDAPKGEVERIKRDELNDKLEEGDMLICRTNAPLVSLCFSLIMDGKPARIKGRSIGEGLVSAAKNIVSRGDFKGWKEFRASVAAWRERESNKVLKRNGGEEEDSRLQMIEDKAECMIVIWVKSKAESLDEFRRVVEDLFSDERPGIQLSSIHRAKGLEADRVFVLRPDLLPGPWATPGTWQYEQELNLRYISLSRSKRYLCFVDKNEVKKED